MSIKIYSITKLLLKCNSGSQNVIKLDGYQRLKKIDNATENS